MRFCLAIFYGLDQESEDKLSKDEWQLFAGLSLTWFNIWCFGTGVETERQEEMEPIVRNAFEPARSLGICGLIPRRMLRCFGYSVTNLHYPAGGLKGYRSLDLEVQEERGWIIDAMDLGVTLGVNEKLLINQLYPPDSAFRQRILRAHYNVVRKYFTILTQALLPLGS